MSDYIATNGPMVTTAAYVPVTTGPGTVVKTILQLTAGPNDPLTIWKWGLDFDGTGTTPIKCELIHTGTIAATTNMTAYVASGLQPLSSDQSPSACVLTAAASGYSGATQPTEGTITVTRYGAINSVLPGNGDRNEWSLGREFFVPASGVVRIRVTASAIVNCAAYICWSE